MINTLDPAIIPAEYEIKEIPKTEYTSVLSRSEVRELVSKYDWDVELMTAVFMAESSASSTVVNWGDSHLTCDGSYGLAQIACLHVEDPETLKDPVVNIGVAYKLWKRDGINIWGSYTDGSYKNYLF